MDADSFLLLTALRTIRNEIAQQSGLTQYID